VNWDELAALLGSGLRLNQIAGALPTFEQRDNTFA
jgi:hypothetical protein